MNIQEFSKPNQKGRTGGHEIDNHSEEELKAAMGNHDDGETQRVTKGQTELHIASGEGDIVEVQRLLDHGANVNAIDENGWQPLHEAVHSGQLDIVKLLVERGADISAKTNNGGTPLWWAMGTFGDDHEVTQYLLSIDAPDMGIDLD